VAAQASASGGEEDEEVMKAKKGKKVSKEPINWEGVERVMLKSFKGRLLSWEEEQLYLDAYKRDPKEYGERQQRIRNEEILRVQRTGVL
jgi:hypothetical protein